MKGLKEKTTELIEEKDMEEMEANVKKYKQEWNKKKKECLGIIDMISEGMDSPPNQIFVSCLQLHRNL